jgi:hypothetical protein
MIRARLIESYQNWYWNSATGVTLRKDDREGQMVDENDKMIRRALDQGFLEIVSEEELAKVRALNKKAEEAKKTEKDSGKKIIEDKVDTSRTIKEVITLENTEQMNRIKEGSINGTNNIKSSNKENQL